MVQIPLIPEILPIWCSEAFTGRNGIHLPKILSHKFLTVFSTAIPFSSNRALISPIPISILAKKQKITKLPSQKLNLVHFNMKIISVLLISIFLFSSESGENKADYLNDLKIELQQKWPENRTINLVFHGHSVPAGYFKTPVANTLESYPYQVLKELKAKYPYAVINIINTSIGGEDSN